MNTELPFPAEFNKECCHKPIPPFAFVPPTESDWLPLCLLLPQLGVTFISVPLQRSNVLLRRRSCYCADGRVTVQTVVLLRRRSCYCADGRVTVQTVVLLRRRSCYCADGRVTVQTVVSQLCYELFQFNTNKLFHSCRRLCVWGQQMEDKSWCPRRGPVCSGQL